MKNLQVFVTGEYPDNEYVHNRMHIFTDDIDGVMVTEHGQVECRGSVGQARAKRCGRMLLTGSTRRVDATDGGLIYCRADPELVRAAYSGRTAILGNPDRVLADHNGSVTVFGEPRSITATGQSRVTVVSLNSGYHPESEPYVNDSSDIRIIRPGTERSHNPSSYLSLSLKELFSGVSDNPLLDRYASLLLWNHETSLPVTT
jgi:hypothetical protein